MQKKDTKKKELAEKPTMTKPATVYKAARYPVTEPADVQIKLEVPEEAPKETPKEVTPPPLILESDRNWKSFHA